MVRCGVYRASRARAIGGPAPDRAPWLAVTCAVLGCAGTPTNGAEAPEIGAVEIAGQTELDTSDLVSGLANAPPEGWIRKTYTRLDRLALEIDRRRVTSFYHEQGFFSVRVREAEVIGADDDRVIVRFRVEEGEPAIVRQVAVVLTSQTSTAPREAELLEVSHLATGERFAYPEYEAGKARIRDHLRSLGYARAEVEGEVEVARSSGAARITYRATPGPVVHLGEAVMTGSTALPASSVLSRAVFERGDHYHPALLSKTEQRVSELSLAGAVRTSLLDTGDPAVADVLIDVEDTTPNELRLGGGFAISSPFYEVRGRVGYTRYHFFHPLYTFRAELRPALSYIKADGSIAPRIEASTEILRDDFLIPRLSLTVGADFSVEQYEIYATVGPSVYLTLVRPIADDRLFLGARLQLSNLALFSDAAEADQEILGLFNPQRVVFFAPSLSYDDRDNLLSAHRGVLLRLEAELGSVLTPGGGAYLRATAETRGYLPLGTDRLVIGAKLRFGASPTSLGTVPTIRRYFSGGAESQRGFGYRQLGPSVVVPQGDKTVRGPVGGEALLEASLELRVELIEIFDSWLAVVAFLDAGDVTAALSELDPLRLHWAAGPGLRLHTPVGPLRFDFGFRLNRLGPTEPEPDSTWSFHFSLGEAF